MHNQRFLVVRDIHKDFTRKCYTANKNVKSNLKADEATFR